MPKSPRGRPPAHTQRSLGAAEQGLRHFQAGRLDAAIETWSALRPLSPPVQAALAEALFRRALAQPDDPPQVLADLQWALELAPAEARYRYHLGMHLHRMDDRDGARAAYEAVIAAGGPAGAALLLAIVALEDRPRTDVSRLPGVTPAIVTLIAPLQALLRGAEPTAEQLAAAEPIVLQHYDTAVAQALLTFWKGLGEVQRGDPAAGETLADQRTLPTTALTALRRFYRGVAAAHAGDDATAYEHWMKVAASGRVPAALGQNLASALYDRLNALIAAGSVTEAAQLALQSITLPLAPTPALDELRVQLLDQAAHAAAGRTQWRQAADYWEGARLIVGTSAALGSPRPLWHNLALAYEAQEAWEQAADAWRGMLRTRPRRGGKAEDALSDEQWAWVRARVIECYRQAGRPDEAVTVFRQMIKADPNDLAVRLQLADALLANEQEQAAFNEVQRILKIDPNFVEARMRSAAFNSVRGYLPEAERELRDLVRRHPERDDIRRAFATMLLDHAGQYIGGDRRQNQHGLKLLEEGRTLEPSNPQFPLDMARAQFNLGKRDAGRKLLAEALELAGERLDIYAEVYEAWLIERDRAQAAAVMEQVQALNPPPEFYIDMGTRAIRRGAGPAAALSPFEALMGTRPKQAQPHADPEWTHFGIELLNRGLAVRPDDPKLHLAVAVSVMGAANELAIVHAERAVALNSADLQTQIIFGITLAMAERKREAKEQLRKTAVLARKQGQPALAQEADELRRQVDSPFFADMIRMQLTQPLDMDELADEFF